MSNAVALRVVQRGLLRELSSLDGAPAWLRAQVTQAGEGLALAERHDVLWIEPVLLESDPRYARGWLESEATLALGETRSLEVALAPTVIVARDTWYDALANEVTSRAARSGRVRRTLLSWALETRWRRLARALVVAPLIDQLGLRHASSLYVVGAPSVATRALFRSLGLTLRALESASSARHAQATLVFAEVAV